jgi:SAM-dependent methyltransferase
MNSNLQNPHDLLKNHLHFLTALNRSLPVLDLACGTGRDGLMLAKHGIPVVFADKSASALEAVEQQLVKLKLPGRTWQVDLEKPGISPIVGQAFSAVIGFSYLHRPLFPALLAAVIPGGMVVYETFTTINHRHGGPTNPDFLLLPGELEAIFKDWEIIFYFEGDLQNPNRSVAQLVARKPQQSF